MQKAVFFLLLATFLTFAPSAFAAIGDVNDGNGYKITQKEFEEYHAAVKNCETPSLECLVRYTTRFVAIEWVNDILGPDQKIVETADGSNGSGTPVAQGGVVSGTFQLIGMMYANPPADTRTFVADVMDSADLAPKAYAQGLGFASLNPVLNLWKAFRNISYFFFIIFFIVIGFMIMFRQKISGQVAVTAQQAIPSVIVSLILVTFSYAIAGFMIDLMYLLMFMIVGVFSDILKSGIGQTASDNVIDMNILQITGTMFSAIWDKSKATQNMLTAMLAAITDQAQASTTTEIAGMIGGLTLSLVIAIAVLINAFKLFFELLKSYFSVIVAVVTAPVILMFGALPGKNVFWPWLKNIIGNLAAFPAVLLVIVLFLEFTQGVTASSAGGFMPPFLIGSGQGGMIAPLLGFATILALPEIVKKVKAGLGASEGGVLWELAGAAGKSLKSGEVAIPYGMGAVGGAVGGARGVSEGWREGRRRPLQLARDFVRGYTHDDGRRVGGFAPVASKQFRRGMNIRKNIDRMTEGRFFEAEDMEKYLGEIAASVRENKDKKEVQDPTTPKTTT